MNCCKTLWDKLLNILTFTLFNTSLVALSLEYSLSIGVPLKSPNPEIDHFQPSNWIKGFGPKYSSLPAHNRIGQWSDTPGFRNSTMNWFYFSNHEVLLKAVSNFQEMKTSPSLLLLQVRIGPTKPRSDTSIAYKHSANSFSKEVRLYLPDFSIELLTTSKSPTSSQRLLPLIVLTCSIFSQRFLLSIPSLLA